MEQSAGFDLEVRGSDSVRLDIFGPFGIPVGSALFTRGSYIVYSALNNTVYKGSPEQPLRMLPFAGEIPFELLIGTLRGIHPGVGNAVIDSLRRDEEGRYTFTVNRNRGYHDSFRYDPGVERILRCVRRDDEGIQLWSIAYRYGKNDSAVVPQQVEIRFPAKEARLLIDYDEVQNSVNTSPLEIEIPADAIVVTSE